MNDAQEGAGMEQKPRRGSLIGPIVLIGLGLVFLLDNLGVVQWDIWQILFRLWPVLLIAAGLDLVVGRRSTAGTLVVILVVVGLVVAGVWVLSDSLSGSPRTETIRQSLEGAERAEIQIDGSVGRLHIGTHSESGTLILGTLDLSPSEQVRQDFQVVEGTARYSLKSESVWRLPDWGGFGQDRVWDLELTRQVPVRLTLDAGVGQSVLELSPLQATEISVNAGVGQMTITLPASGRYSAQLDSGVGEVIIILPVGLAARITVSTGLGDVQVSGDLRHEGDIYISPGFEDSENRVELDVSGGVGRIVIRRESGG